MSDNKNPADYDTAPPAESVNPQPDPGNSPPEAWTEPLTAEEDQEARDALAAAKAADFIVLEDGTVKRMGEHVAEESRPKTEEELAVSFVEPTDSAPETIHHEPVEDAYAKDGLVPPAPETQEANADDGSGSPSN